MSKRVVAPAVGLAAVVLVTGSGAPARADRGTCPVGSACLYAEYDQQGEPRLTTSRDVPELYPPPAPLSVSNAAGRWVLLYEGPRYTALCVAVRGEANLGGGPVRSVRVGEDDSGDCEPTG